MNKLNYKEPRNVELEQKILDTYDVCDLERECWKNYNRETDKGYDEAQAADWRLRDSVRNLFIDAYNAADTSMPPREAAEIIDNFMQWNDEDGAVNIPDLIDEFKKLLY